MVSKQVMLKKKGKRKSKKTTTTTRGGVKVINNIHVNSKSGTRSKRQQRGGVGGSVVPSGASTISHVPLVMNVPAPDSTQRETKWMHALEDIQSDNVALRMQLDEFVKKQGVGSAPNLDDKKPFQDPPSKANFEDAPVEAEARGGIRGRIPRGLQIASRADDPLILRSASSPPMMEARVSMPRKETARSSQGIGLQAEDVGPSGGGGPSPAKKGPGRPPSAKKQAKKAAEEVKAGKQRTMEEFKK